MHGIQTDLLVLAVEVVILVLDGTAGVNADFLMEMFFERHMILSVPGRAVAQGQNAVSSSSPL